MSEITRQERIEAGVRAMLDPKTVSDIGAILAWEDAQPRSSATAVIARRTVRRIIDAAYPEFDVAEPTP